MSKHISDELPRLLTGDATHDLVMEAAEHLRSCPDCQQELVSSVVAHASLTSAHRFAPEVVAPTAHDDRALPPVARLHDAQHADGEGARSATPDEPGALPDMTSMFDQVRAEAAQADAPTFGRRGRRGLLAVAAAAVVLAAGGTAIGFAVEGGGTTGQTVALGRFDLGHGHGTATIDDDTVTLTASSLPRLSATDRYEVWLTNAARTKMYSIGFLGDGSSASFKVKHDYLTAFSAIEVSRQEAGKTQYSGESVLRGTYS